MYATSLRKLHDITILFYFLVITIFLGFVKFFGRKRKGDRSLDIERDYGFRLMIHDRDWIAGRTIRANIMDGIEKSRRVIFILSK